MRTLPARPRHRDDRSGKRRPRQRAARCQRPVRAFPKPIQRRRARVPARLHWMREEAQRIDGRLEGTLRVPDGEPRAIVVSAHPLPTHGGEMRNPLVAGIARACAERGWYALRFNFRGVGASAGEWTGGRHETDDVEAAVDYARTLAPGLPLGLVGYSFGAFQALAFL